MCSMRFTMTRRRHHCRGCGKVSLCMSLHLALYSPGCRYSVVHAHLIWLLSSIKATKWTVCVKAVLRSYQVVNEWHIRELIIHTEINGKLNGSCRTSHKQLKHKTMRSSTKLIKPAVLEVNKTEPLVVVSIII